MNPNVTVEAAPQRAKQGRPKGSLGHKRKHEMIVAQQGSCDGACGRCRIQAPTPSATTSVALFTQEAPEPARARSPVSDERMAEVERELDEANKEFEEAQERVRAEEEKRKRFDKLKAQVEDRRARTAQLCKR